MKKYMFAPARTISVALFVVIISAAAHAHTVPTVEQLKTYTERDRAVTLTGYYNDGDLVPYTPRYIIAASGCSLNAGAGDGGSQIPLSNGGCAVYARPPAIVTALMFGMKTEAETQEDQSARLQALFNYVDGLSTPTQVVLAPGGGTYRISSGLKGPNITNVTFSCGGAEIDATGIKSGALFAPYTTWRVANTQGLSSAQHPFGPCNLHGPNYQSRSPATVYAIAPTPQPYRSSLPWNVGMKFQSIGAQGFDALFVVTGGAVGWAIVDAIYTNSYGVSSGAFLLIPAGVGTKNNERIDIDRAFVADTSDCILDAGGGANLDIYINDSSCDGTTRVLTGGPNAAGLHLFANGWHVEQSAALLSPSCPTEPFFHLGQSGVVDWSGGEFLVGNNGCATPSVSPVVVDAPAGTGQGNLGFSMRGVSVNWGAQVPLKSVPPLFFGGQGRVFIEDTSAVGHTYAALTGYSNNLIPGNEFATAANIGSGAGKWNARGSGHVSFNGGDSPTRFSARAMLTAEKSVVTGLTSGAIQPGLKVSGSGVPASTVAQLTGIPGAFFLSHNATASGAQTLSFTGGSMIVTSPASAGTETATFIVPACRVGSAVAFTTQLKTSNVAATGGMVVLAVVFEDAAGNNLLSFPSSVTGGAQVFSTKSDIANWTTAGGAVRNAIVPGGTAQIAFVVQVTRGNSGSGPAVVGVGEAYATCQ